MLPLPTIPNPFSFLHIPTGSGGDFLVLRVGTSPLDGPKYPSPSMGDGYLSIPAGLPMVQMAHPVAGPYGVRRERPIRGGWALRGAVQMAHPGAGPYGVKNVLRAIRGNGKMIMGDKNGKI